MQPAKFTIPSFEECPSRGLRRVNRDQAGVAPNEDDCPVAADGDIIDAPATTANKQSQTPPESNELTSMHDQRKAWRQARHRSNATTAASCFSKIDELIKTLPSSIPANQTTRNACDRFPWSEGEGPMEGSTRTLQAGNLSSSDFSAWGSLEIGNSTRTLQASNRSSTDFNVSIPDLSELSTVRSIRGVVPRMDTREKVSARRSKSKGNSISAKSRSPHTEKRKSDPGEQRSGSKSPHLLVREEGKLARSRSPKRLDAVVAAGRERKSRSKSPRMDSSKKMILKSKTRARSTDHDTRTRGASKRSKSRKRGASRSKSRHRGRPSRDDLSLEPSTHRGRSSRDDLSPERSAPRRRSCKEEATSEQSAHQRRSSMEELASEPSPPRRRSCKEELASEQSAQRRRSSKEELSSEPSAHRRRSHKEDLTSEQSGHRRRSYKEESPPDPPLC